MATKCKCAFSEVGVAVPALVQSRLLNALGSIHPVRRCLSFMCLCFMCDYQWFPIVTGAYDEERMIRTASGGLERVLA